MEGRGSDVSRVWVSRHAVVECAFDSKSDTRLVFMKLSVAQGSSEAAARCPGHPEAKWAEQTANAPHHPTSRVRLKSNTEVQN